MMTNRHNRKFDQMIFYTIEQLVPEDHLVRKLEDAIEVVSKVYEKPRQ